MDLNWPVIPIQPFRGRYISEMISICPLATYLEKGKHSMKLRNENLYIWIFFQGGDDVPFPPCLLSMLQAMFSSAKWDLPFIVEHHSSFHIAVFFFPLAATTSTPNVPSPLCGVPPAGLHTGHDKPNLRHQYCSAI